MTPLFFRATCRPVPKRGHVRALQRKLSRDSSIFFTTGKYAFNKATRMSALRGATCQPVGSGDFPVACTGMHGSSFPDGLNLVLDFRVVQFERLLLDRCQRLLFRFALVLCS